MKKLFFNLPHITPLAVGLEFNPYYNKGKEDAQRALPEPSISSTRETYENQGHAARDSSDAVSILIPLDGL